jgi:hypothetical protein
MERDNGINTAANATPSIPPVKDNTTLSVSS